MAENKTLSMVYIAIFAVIIAVCSWITIPFGVPFTLQTFAVFLAVAVLGGKRGSAAVAMYILTGAVGIPVFSGFRGGLGVLLGATGGYILGFLVSALLMWGMEAFLGKKTWVYHLSMVLGLLLCYAFGSIWYILLYAGDIGRTGLAAVLSQCVLPFIIPDGIKLVLVIIVRKRLLKIWRRDS